MMHKMRIAAHLAVLQLRKSIMTQKTAVVAVMMALYIFAMLQPVVDFSNDAGIAVTPLGITFLVSDSVVQMIMMAGAVVLFAHAPFEDESFQYYITRAGKGAWIAGNSMHIAIMSAMYVLFIWFISVVSMLPNLDFSIAWGKIWGTLSATDAGHRYGVMFTIPDSIRNCYTPKEALIWTLLLESGCVAFLGATVYLGNRVSDRQLGTWIGCAIVLFEITIYNLFPGAWNKFSPLSLAMIVYSIRSKWGITLQYSLAFLWGGFAILSVINYATMKWRIGRRQ